jgi:hypothetical protein
MKTIIYYLLLLIFVALIAGYLISGQASAMGMSQMIGVSAALVLYTIAISLVGEGPKTDEREVLHRNLSNRAGLVAGTIVFSVGLIYQLFVSHKLDWWLLAGLIAINLTKITALIYLNYKK